MRLTSRGQLISVGLRGGGTPLPPPRISARIIRGLACRPLLFSSPIFSFSFPPPFSSAFFEIRGQFGPNTGHGLYRRLCLHTNEAFASRTTIDLSTIFFPSRFDNVSSFADESFPPEINNTGGLNRVLDKKEIGYVSSPWLGGKWTCGPFYCLIVIVIFKFQLNSFKHHEILRCCNCW